eukprot:4903846-Prymnesium_polylepis.1
MHKAYTQFPAIPRPLSRGGQPAPARLLCGVHITQCTLASGAARTRGEARHATPFIAARTWPDASRTSCAAPRRPAAL